MLNPARRLERGVRGVAASTPAPSNEALTATPRREKGLSDSVCAEQTVKSMRATRNEDVKTNEDRRGIGVTPIHFDSGWLPGSGSTRNSARRNQRHFARTESGRIPAKAHRSDVCLSQERAAFTRGSNHAQVTRDSECHLLAITKIHKFQ